MWTQILVIFIVVTFLIGCGGGSGSSGSNVVTTNEVTIERENSEEQKNVFVTYELTSLFSPYQNLSLPPIVPTFNETKEMNAEGYLTVKNLNTGETNKYKKDFFIDLYTFEIEAEEDLKLPDGDYEISLLIEFLGKEYSSSVVGKENFHFKLSPNVGEGSFNEISIDYFTTDLFYKTKFISLSNENEEVFYRVNSASFLRTVYVSEEFTTIKFYDEDDVFFTSSLESLEVLVKE